MYPFAKAAVLQDAFHYRFIVYGNEPDALFLEV